MKKKLQSIIVFGMALLSLQMALAQGTTYLSNLGLTPTSSNPVGSDSWLAAGIYTGGNGAGYALNSVQLAITAASGNPSGFAVMVYGNDGNPAGENPGTSLGTLIGASDPQTTGIYTYAAASAITLLPETQYYLVLTGGTSIANGFYGWNYTTTSSYQPGDAWVASVTLGSNNGLVSSWTRLGVGQEYDFSQFALGATALPEPSIEILLGVGGILLFGFCRWKTRLAQ